MRTLRRFAALVVYFFHVALLAFSGAATAFPGSLDTTFGCAAPPCSGIALTGIPPTSGAATGRAMALQPADGKIVMAGSAGTGTASGFAVARFNANGTLDTSFNGNGTNVTQFGTGDDHANAVAIQSDGKIVAAGSSFSSFVYTFALTRYNADGTADTGFGNKTTTIGTTYNDIFAVTVDGAGKILMAGKTGDTAATDFAVLRYTSAGTLDSTFNGTGKVRTQYPTACSGGGCIGQAQAIAIQPDGKIVVAGWSGPLGNSEFMIVRYNTNGTLDSTFGTNGIKVHSLSGGNDSAYAVKIVGSNILVAGTTDPTGSKASYALVRYTSSGAVDTSFGTNGVVVTSLSGGNDVAASIAIAADGRIIIGGDANDVSGEFAVARYSANGVLDNTFGCATAGSCPGYVQTNLAGTDQGKAVAIQSDGNIVLGGVAGAGTASAKFAVARYLGSGSTGGGNGPTQLAVTSVNGGNPIGAGVAFAVVVQSRNAAGAPTNVIAATQVSLALTTGTGPLNGTAACTIAAGGNGCTIGGLTMTAVQTNAVVTASAVSGDALASGAGGPFAVVPGPAASIQVSGYPASSSAGSSNAFTVRARDAYDNTATGYTGTVHFTSTDAAAGLPANYAFTAGDAGVHQFSASMNTVGTWTLTATDTATGSITGTQTGLMVTASGAATLTIVSGNNQNASVNTDFGAPLIVQLRDAGSNPVANAQVTFTAPGTGASATLGGSTSQVVSTNASGNAQTGTVRANLTGGTYNVTASSSGLTAGFSLTNNKVNSTTTLARTSGTSPAAVNSSLTFTATVSGGTGTPTGSVNFLVDGLPLCSGVALNASAQAACTTQALTAGNRSLSAQYQGNGTYNSSASSALAQTMSKNTPTVAITGTSSNPSGINAAVTVNFTVTPSPAGPLSPTGNVTVSDGTLTCTGTVAAGQCSITFTSAGQKTLTASYAGDGNFNAASSAGFSQTVSNTGATVSLSANPTTVLVGSTTTIAATVTGGQGTPTGIVSVSGAGGSCAITLSGGTGSCVMTANTVGNNQTITGNYGGNGTYGTSSGTTQLTVNSAGGSHSLTVTKRGSGAGTVTSNPSGINCGTDCSESFANPTQVTLTASSTGGSQFIGWLGACTGTAQCVVSVSGARSVSATFAPNQTNPRLDIDNNNAYDALTDGLLVLRYMSGLTGPALIQGAIGGNAQRGTAASILLFLDDIRPKLDIDGNGIVDPLTDGMLVVRYLFGLREAALIDNATGAGAIRFRADQIQPYLQTLTP